MFNYKINHAQAMAFSMALVRTCSLSNWLLVFGLFHAGLDNYLHPDLTLSFQLFKQCAVSLNVCV